MPAAPPLPAASGRPRSRRRTASAIVLALSVAMLSFNGPGAHADTVDPTANDALHQSDGPQEQSSLTQALAQAKSSGSPVVVDTMTTPYQQTSANPDGTVSTTQSADPVRAKVAGSWVAVDASLVANTDGTYSPKAAASPLVLSGGGTGPLATLTNSDSKALSVTFPFTLPAPTVSGATATYANVLPDVDLDVTANIRGGINEVLVVKTATAAANPALSTLNITTSGAGLTVNSDASGNLQAVDTGTNTSEFTSPAASMWDSTSSATTSTATRMLAASTSSTPISGTSDTAGPGAGAQSASVPTTVNGSTVTLAPVSSILNGSGTHYPVFIDPDWLPGNAGTPTWAWVQSAYPDTNTGSYSGSTDYPGIGICGSYPNGGGCSPTDTERIYYQFNTSEFAGYTLHNATLNLSEYDSADFSCINAYPITLYQSAATTPISGSTTWNHHPSDTSLGLTDQVPGSGGSACYANVPFNYTVTSQVQGAIGAGHITFGLYGNESNDWGFKHLTRNPTLTITYDVKPNTPTQADLSTSPVTQETSTSSTSPCDTNGATTTAWLQKPGSTGLSLKAYISSPVNQQVRGWFSIWDDSVTGPDIASGYSNGGAVQANKSTATFSVPTSALTDGHLYGWHMFADDTLTSSAFSPVCHFRADLTAPTASFGTTSTDFPPAGSGQSSTKSAGQTGSIPFTANDQVVNGYASGVACLRWSFDPQFAGASWVCGSNMPTGSIQATPPHWGTNIVFLQAMDNAGNTSQPASYAFYAPWNSSAAKPVFGDTTGDGTPDMVVPGPDGNLYNHSVPGNPLASSPALSLAALKIDSPGQDSWSNYRVAHRGSLRGGVNVDDLLVHKASDPKLWVYQNPGNTGTDGRFDTHTPLAKPTCHDPNSDQHCVGYATDWSTTASFIATGDVSTTNLNAGNFQDRTGILTEEANTSGDYALWFYPTVSDGTLGEPVRLNTTGWGGWDLIAPGDWHNDGHPGIWARDRATGDINAYTLTTGTLTTYDQFNNPINTPTVTAITLTSSKIGTGVTAANFPLIGSEGDLTAHGISDLWATTTNNVLQVWPGVTTNSIVTGFANHLVAGTTGASDQWPLAQPPSGTTTLADTDATNNLAVSTSGVTWVNDRHLVANGAAHFDGTNGYLRAANPALDTSHSYTVSAWVNLDNLNTSQDLVSQGTVNHQAFYLGYDHNTNSWYFQTTTSDNASTTYPTAAGPAGDATYGTWTHLTGVYNADAGTITLYVNGAYAGSDSDTSPVTSNGPLNIGANVLAGGGSPYNQSTGAVSDVRTYGQALTPSQVNQLYTTTK